MASSNIRYNTYPRTKTPNELAEPVVEAFRKHESEISTEELDDGLVSDDVLSVVREDLEEIGFNVETGKKKNEKIHRPVLYGENGEPDLKYEVDAYHQENRLGLEVEAGRAVNGNAIYRDLIQGLMMVKVDILALAVPNVYKHSSGSRKTYKTTRSVVETLYETHRVELPYDCILIGY